MIAVWILIKINDRSLIVKKSN